MESSHDPRFEAERSPSDDIQGTVIAAAIGIREIGNRTVCDMTVPGGSWTATRPKGPKYRRQAAPAMARDAATIESRREFRHTFG
jgi:hypothetical protein